MRISSALARTVPAALLLGGAALAAEMETKVLLHETYEKHAQGRVPKGVTGADHAKGAVIEVVSPKLAGRSNSLMFVDVPNMPKTFST